MNATDRDLIRQDRPAPPPPRQRGRPGIGPFILIGLGLLWLLENLGWRVGGVWNALATWWPAILIVVGLDLLTRQTTWGRTVTLIAAALAALLLLVATISPRTLGRIEAVTLAEPVASATARAEVTLAMGVGRLELRGSPDRLVAGRLEWRGSERIERQIAQRDGLATVRLEQRSTGPNPGWGLGRGIAEPTWNLQLSERLPMVLRVSTGVGASTLELSTMHISELTLNAGIGDTTMTLPRDASLTARVTGGIGNTRIRIPQRLGAKIHATSGLGAVDVIGDFDRDGDTYTSQNAASATRQLDLEVKGGIGKITVERIP